MRKYAPVEFASPYLEREHHISTNIWVFFCLLCQQNEFEERATKKVDDLLESYMGIRDLELGKTTHVTLVSLKQTSPLSLDVSHS